MNITPFQDAQPDELVHLFVDAVLITTVILVGALVCVWLLNRWTNR